MNEQQPAIVDVTESNIEEIVKQSLERPVLLDIWAKWCEPCKIQQPILENLVAAYAGKFLLAKLNADTPLAPQLMQQLGVRGVPALALFHQGKPVNVLSGVQTEATLNKLLTPLMLSPVEKIKGQIDELVSMGHNDQALALVRQVLAEEPENHALQVLQVNLLLETGQIEQAKQIIATVPDDTKGIAQPKAKLAFYELVGDAPAREELEDRLSANSNDHEARYQLAIRHVIDDDNAQALEHLLFIVRRDRAFRDDGARLLMVKVFEQLGAGHALVKKYRGKLFSLLH
ncbi:tetratricopeptide repeat protein [Candidatus Sororendozoicomonas aggregata]|uniref:tetratricopeptide repeat protein n=1 Tax=Candidatus Sororendozoicomonas aggregata TaxID=3073239 RepID=UPI002ED2F435